MPRSRRARPHRIQLSDSLPAHQLQADAWRDLVSKRLAVVIREDGREHIAKLSPRVFGFVCNGELIVLAVGPSIRSSWDTCEREFYFHKAPNWNNAPDLTRQVNERILIEQRELILRNREREIQFECLLWKYHMGRKGKNEVTYLTVDQANEVFEAMRPGQVIPSELRAVRQPMDPALNSRHVSGLSA